LSGTLRTFQRAGCDDEVVTLRCPHGTSISVQVAQYGKSAPSKAVCPPHSSTPGQQELPPNITCLWPNALQVSTIMSCVVAFSVVQTFVDRCQVNSRFTFKSVSEDQRAIVMGILSENSKKKKYPKSVTEVLPPRRHGFKPGSGQVGFMVNKVALGQVFSEYFVPPNSPSS
jgi:hypothetical protein